MTKKQIDTNQNENKSIGTASDNPYHTPCHALSMSAAVAAASMHLEGSAVPISRFRARFARFPEA